MARRANRSGQSNSGGRPIMRDSPIDWSQHYLGTGPVPQPSAEQPRQPAPAAQPRATPRATAQPRPGPRTGQTLPFDDFRIMARLSSPHDSAVAVQDELWTKIIQEPQPNAWVLRRARGLGVVVCDQYDVMAAKTQNSNEVRRRTSFDTLRAIGSAALPVLGNVHPTGMAFAAVPEIINSGTGRRHDLRVLYDPSAPGNERLAEAQQVIRRELAYSLATDVDTLQLTTPYLSLATVRSDALPEATGFTETFDQTYIGKYFAFDTPQPSTKISNYHSRGIRWDRYFDARVNYDTTLPAGHLADTATSLGYAVAGTQPNIHIYR